MPFTKSVVIFFVLTISTPWFPGSGGGGQATAKPYSLMDPFSNDFDDSQHAGPLLQSPAPPSQDQMDQMLLSQQFNQYQQMDIDNGFAAGPAFWYPGYERYPPWPSQFPMGRFPPQAPGHDYRPTQNNLPCPNSQTGACENSGPPDSNISIGEVMSGNAPIFMNTIEASGHTGEIISTFGNNIVVLRSIV